MRYTIGICDDCAEQIELLTAFLRDCEESGVFHILQASEPESFFETLKTDRPDLVFLDVDMAGMNGIELGEKIRALYENTVIVYITGYEKYAFEAFQLRAFHYLLKPVTREKFRSVLQEALDRVKKQRTTVPKKMFSVQIRGEMNCLSYADINYFEKVGHKIKIHTSTRDILYYGQLYDLLNGLDPALFARCHQGYVVNIDKIRSFREGKLYLEGNMQLPVGKTYAEDIHSRLKNHLFPGKGTL